METLPDRRCVIYALFDVRLPGRVRYVGLTKVGPRERLNRHKSAARGGKSYPVSEWIRSIGIENLGIRVLEEVLDESDLPSREVYWIAHYFRLRHPLHNANSGGSHPVFDEETIRKRKANYRKPYMSPERKAQWRATLADGRFKGENHHGAKLSESDVLEIRSRLAAGELGVTLASYFHVSHATIMDIKKRRSWTHI